MSKPRITITTMTVVAVAVGGSTITAAVQPLVDSRSCGDLGTNECAPAPMPLHDVRAAEPEQTTPERNGMYDDAGHLGNLSGLGVSASMGVGILTGVLHLTGR